ncbi:hypothetical protein HAX54_021859 [Datura stramonium]|uniref:Uncharacterized protein n=1 Tax=Datura stramonium TaxID=4076 RepID=A0ABS8UTJ7_DATST|nr:hypothetical protein [Datura stramonium]
MSNGCQISDLKPAPTPVWQFGETPIERWCDLMVASGQHLIMCSIGGSPGSRQADSLVMVDGRLVPRIYCFSSAGQQRSADTILWPTGAPPVMLIL